MPQTFDRLPISPAHHLLWRFRGAFHGVFRTGALQGMRSRKAPGAGARDGAGTAWGLGSGLQVGPKSAGFLMGSEGLKPSRKVLCVVSIGRIKQEYLAQNQLVGDLNHPGLPTKMKLDPVVAGR